MQLRWTRRLAFLFFLASAGLTVYLLRRPSIVFLTGSAAIGSAAYLFISRSASPVETRTTFALNERTKGRIKQLAATAFFLLSAASLLEVVRHPFGKTMLYYGLVAAAAACLAVRTTLLRPGREVPVNLALVLLLALNLFGTDQLAFPSGIGGGDADTHLYYLVQPVLQTGHLPPLDACGLIYVTFPAHHVLVASASLYSGLAAATTYYTMGFLVMLVPVVTAFLVGRRLLGDRGGLLAALVLSGSSYFIFWAAHASTLTFAVPYIAMVLLAVLLTMDRPTVRMYGCIFVFLFALVLTHPYSSVVFGFVVAGLMIGQILIHRDKPSVLWAPRILGASFVYILLIYWSNYTCLMTKSFQLAVGYAQAIAGEQLASSPAIYDTLPLSTIFQNTIGDSLLQVLVVLGFFLWLRDGLSGRRMLIVVPTVALLVLGGIGLFTRLAYLLPNRVYVFLEFLGLAPLAAVALREVTFLSLRRSARARPAVVLGVVAALVFAFVLASASSTIAGFETSPYVGTQPYTKLYDTRYETGASLWICANVPLESTVNASRSLNAYERYRVRNCIETGNRTVGWIDYRDIGTTGVRTALNVSGIAPGSYVWFSEYDAHPGYLAGVTAAGQTGRGVYGKLLLNSTAALGTFDKLYDAGPVEVYWLPR